MKYNDIQVFLDEKHYARLSEQSNNQLSNWFGQDFAMMQGYSQNNPHHCYSLLEHTLQTLLALDCEGLCDSERLELQIAALYHDVGKPKVAFEKNGKTVFYNHANEYVVLLPVEESGEADEVVILKLEESENEDEESYVGVEDQDALNAVFAIFKDKFKDEFNFVD